MLEFERRGRGGTIVITRFPHDTHALVTFEDGASEEVEGSLLSKYLEVLGVRDPGRIADRVWNFYKVTIILKEKEAQHEVRSA
jgi:hypothetical protein